VVVGTGLVVVEELVQSFHCLVVVVVGTYGVVVEELVQSCHPVEEDVYGVVVEDDVQSPQVFVDEVDEDV
jgi:hypothetical protein